MTNMQLPAQYADVAAEEFVREEIAWFRANKLPVLGIDVACFDDASARNFALQVLKNYALSHPVCMMNVVDDAKDGWDLADEALRELILEFNDRGELPPTYLSAFAMDIVARGLTPKHIPGPKKTDKFFRDIVTAVIIGKAAKQFRLRPTRSGKRAQSACSVVAREMGMAEETVVTIWKKYGRPNFTRDFNILPW
jgi:hypothetical protein